MKGRIFSLKIVTALALALLALGTTLAGVTTHAAPRRAVALPPARPLRAEVSIVKAASTELDPASGATVADGGWITYTITVQNIGGTALSDLLIEDILPSDTLDEDSITCLDDLGCTKIQGTTILFDSEGNKIGEIQAVKTLSWTVAALAANETVSVQFKGQVICHSGGFDFANGARVSGAGFDTTSSNLVETTVEFSPPSENGKAQLSDGPTWCSTEQAENLDMDWGDADADGDLDLMIASTDLGAVIYRNEEGQFTRLGSIYNDSTLTGARWADFNNDDKLDVLITGKWDTAKGMAPPGAVFSVSNHYSHTGYNNIYKNNGADGAELATADFTLYDSGGTSKDGSPFTFQSSDTILRAAPADYNDDSYVDLATANPVGGCTLQLYDNIRPTTSLPTSSCDCNSGDTLNCSDFADTGEDAQACYNLCWDEKGLDVHELDGDSDGLACEWNPETSVVSDTEVVFQKIIDWDTSDVHCLVADEPAYSVAWSDYDNDGLLELTAGISDQIRIFEQDSRHDFSTVPTYSFSDFGSYPAYDLAWGDYDGDGLLDLAAAIGYTQPTRIYRNAGGIFAPTATLTIAPDAEVLAVDWADFDGDGELELAVADKPPKIYDLDDLETPWLTMPVGSGTGNLYAIRGTDFDNDGDIDLSFVNSSDKNLLYNTFAPFLEEQLTPIDVSLSATSVAWGDHDNDEDYDFVVGATSSVNKLYYNDNNGISFSAGPEFVVNGRTVIFNDLNSDGRQDVIFGRQGANHVYLAGSSKAPFPDWQSTDTYNSYGLTFGDFDQNNRGDADLIVGNSGGPKILYLNESGTLDTDFAWASVETDDTRTIAWGYYDEDDLPDFAAGNDDGSVQVYQNDGYLNFVLTQTVQTSNTRSIAWGDYDGDGDMDLAVGNYGSPNHIYENLGGSFDSTPAWTSTYSRNTTSVAWGDWDNDGDLDLAVGNYRQPSEVFLNLGSAPGSANMFWIWASAESYDTQSVAWGDADGDGDLDLAVAAIKQSGYYQNNYVAPAHLNNRNMPLPLNPSYIRIQPPTPSSGQIWERTIFSNSTTLIVPLEFTVYDPDGSDQNGNARKDLTLIPGQHPTTPTLEYEYALDGGGKWQAAISGSLSYDETPQRYTYNWGAGTDLSGNSAAVSDDLRFCVRLVNQNKGGRVQHAKTGACTPPFRVRNLSCAWPEGVTLLTPSSIVSGEESSLFEGYVTEAGSGGVYFSWDFGDGTAAESGQLIKHTYTMSGTFVVTLTVTGDACPIARSTFATTTVFVTATEATGNFYYMPIIMAGNTTSADLLPTAPPAQVAGLRGESLPGGTLRLEWPAAETAQGYRLYRAGGGGSFELWADLPATPTTYTDTAATCGLAYFVTAYNVRGESPPSAASYYTAPCR
jgi:uncharacterized repeat protein (TIGR01451 family)